jgi:hypothetical protein
MPGTVPLPAAAVSVDRLARCLVLGVLLDELTTHFGGYDLVAHWTQGEFHHDVVLRVPDPPVAVATMPTDIPIAATLPGIPHAFPGTSPPFPGTSPPFPGTSPPLPGPILVVATNCNGGVKEVLCFRDVPDRRALWHHRCPAIDAFDGELAPILARATTEHWFDPCELLAPDARSELLPEHRRRQEGGGWEHAPPAGRCPR